jgi:hypothetical protein
MSSLQVPHIPPVFTPIRRFVDTAASNWRVGAMLLVSFGGATAIWWQLAPPRYSVNADFLIAGPTTRTNESGESQSALTTVSSLDHLRTKMDLQKQNSLQSFLDFKAASSRLHNARSALNYIEEVAGSEAAVTSIARARFRSDEQLGAVLQPIFSLSRKDQRELSTAKVENSFVGLNIELNGASEPDLVRLVQLLGDFVRDVMLSEELVSYVRRRLGESAVTRLALEGQAAEHDVRRAIIEEKLRLLTALEKRYNSRRPSAGAILPFDQRNARWLPPQDQVVGAESELIDLRTKREWLSSRARQAEFDERYFAAARKQLARSSTGFASLTEFKAKVNEAFRDELVQKDPALRAAASRIASELADIEDRFVHRTRFVVPPEGAVEKTAPNLSLMFASATAAAFTVFVLVCSWRARRVRKYTTV